jgi:type IV pilus assembly protein PilW
MKPESRQLNEKRARRQSGWSLVELMISLTIGLILLAGITTLIVKQNQTRTELEKDSQQIENGRYAIQLLHDDIEHAAFYGEYALPTTTTFDATVNPCVVGTAGWVSATPAVPVGLQGYAGAATDPTPTTCLDNYKANTDVLVIRRTTSDAPIAVAAATAGTAYLQVSRCDTDTSPFIIGTGGFVLKQKDCTTLATLRKYIVRIYYISSCNECGTDTIPTLKMVELTNGTSALRPLVEGIEDMQFDYGIDATGDGSSDSYTTAPAAADWQNVMSVRVNILARNKETSPGYTDNKSYGLSGVSGVPAVSPGGNYRRHVYNEVVRMVNSSGRRE